MFKKTSLFLIPCFALLFLYSSSRLLTYFGAALKSSRDLNALRVLVDESAAHPTSSAAPTHTAVPVPDAVATPQTWVPDPRFSALLESNRDFIGWVKIDGTNIDLPVMYSPDDPLFYLNKNFKREDDIYGTPFLDSRCSVIPNSENLIIYAHNMKNQTMFHDLTLFQDKDFWREHQFVSFDTIFVKAMYQVFAAFVFDLTTASPDGFQFHRPINFNGAVDFSEFIAEIKARALYDTGVCPTFGDELLTLVTCEYSTENSRFVLMARRLD